MKLQNILQFKKSIIAILLIMALIIIVKKSHIPKNQEFLNLFARIAFDKEYYLKEYPDVAKLKISPFEHYSTIGWKENKNPNQEFDNDFYIRMYRTLNPTAPELNPLQHSIWCKFTFKTCYTKPKQLTTATPLENPEHYLAIATIFRDEAPYLKEWIEFYKMMGVSHFYLYNHLSKDNYLEVLNPYIKEGTVEITDFTYEPVDAYDFYMFVCKAYNDAVEKSKNNTEWLIIVDSDEFLYPTKENNLVEVLKKYDDYASVTAPWQFFGSGDVKTIPKDKLIIETLVMAEPIAPMWGKPIVKPRYVETFNSAHYPELKEGYAQVSENYEYFYGPFPPNQKDNSMLVNHYTYRDWDYFWSTKISRIYSTGNLTAAEKAEKIKTLAEQNKARSAVYNDGILRFVPALRTRVFN